MLKSIQKKYSWGKNPNSRNGFKKGYKPTEEHRKRISKALVGIKRGKMSKEHRNKISKKNKGMFSREKHPNWKGGITPLRKKLYFSKEYKLWRTAVFIRDNFTCIWCGYVSKGKKPSDINADHIKPWADYPELRFAIDNGRTLCIPCHRKTNTWGVHRR